MRNWVSRALIALGAALFSTPALASGSTIPMAISDSGEIVGFAVNPSGSGSLAFSYKDGTFHNIQYPGAFSSGASGIDENGVIVGDYYATATGPRTGFSYDGSNFTSISIPNLSSVSGVDSSGAIYGTYIIDSHDQGFRLSGGATTTISYPGATGTVLDGVNGHGDAVGYAYFGFSDMPVLYSNGQFSSLTCPHGSSGCFPYAINNSGVIVGAALMSTGETAYIESGSSFIILNGLNDSGASTANGINDAGTVVGQYYTEDGWVGFEYSGGTYTTLNYPFPPQPSSVPEPATWAMLILGVAMIGFTARRRNMGVVRAA